MPKIVIVKWSGSNGQTAISFPGDGDRTSSPIIRQARFAANEAAMFLMLNWTKTIGRAILQSPIMSMQDHRAYVAAKQKRFHDAALRRYTKLFKAMGLK